MSVPATAPRALRRAFAADEARNDARRQSRAARHLAQRNATVRAGHRRLRTGLYGDADGYRRRLPRLRAALKE